MSNQGLCHLGSVANTTQNFSEINFRSKKNNFLVYGENTYYTISIYEKMFIIEISYNFLYVWNCMELYEKKFIIYDNCMLSIFGQPWEEQREPPCCGICLQCTKCTVLPRNAKKCIETPFLTCFFFKKLPSAQ